MQLSSFHLFPPMLTAEINRFKHNTSFVSRFSTIRRHKPSSQPAQSAVITTGTSGGMGGTTGGTGSTQSPLGNRSRCAALHLVDSLSAQRGSEALCASLGLDRRQMAGSLSEDSVNKEVSDMSKRNSDGKWRFSTFSTYSAPISIMLINLEFQNDIFNSFDNYVEYY